MLRRPTQKLHSETITVMLWKRKTIEISLLGFSQGSADRNHLTMESSVSLFLLCFFWQLVNCKIKTVILTVCAWYHRKSQLEIRCKYIDISRVTCLCCEQRHHTGSLGCSNQKGGEKGARMDIWIWWRRKKTDTGVHTVPQTGSGLTMQSRLAWNSWQFYFNFVIARITDVSHQAQASLLLASYHT